MKISYVNKFRGSCGTSLLLFNGSRLGRRRAGGLTNSPENLCKRFFALFVGIFLEIVGKFPYLGSFSKFPANFIHYFQKIEKRLKIYFVVGSEAKPSDDGEFLHFT